MQSSHHQCREISSFAERVTDFSNYGMDCDQNRHEPASERLVASNQFVDRPSQRVPSDSGYYKNFAKDETCSVIQSGCLQHEYKNWPDARKHKLTASTFGAAVGFWPQRRVQLWLEKIGAIEPFSGNLAISWNNIKEGEALERYQLITGHCVSLLEFQVYGGNNPQENWLAASPDGIADNSVYGLAPRGVLEIKCPFFGGDKSIAYPWKRIPLYYIPQAQGLMEIMDRDWMDFYVWTLNGSSLFRIHRDVQYWSLLKLALSDFWWKHVQPAKELRTKFFITDPLNELKSLMPAPRHELWRSIISESRRVANSSEFLLREINGKLQD